MNVSQILVLPILRVRIAILFAGFMLLLILGNLVAANAQRPHDQLIESYIPEIPTSPKNLSQIDATIPKTNDSRVIIDGTITSSEYNESYMAAAGETTVQVHWEHNGVNLSIGLVSPGTGWVAMGFGEQMDGANLILGGIRGITAYCTDQVGSGHTHTNDTDQGGSYNTIAFAASENDTNTILEFIFPLNPGDSLDPVLLENSSYPMFFAYQDSSDDSIYHTARSDVLSILVRTEGRAITTSFTMESLPSGIQQGDSVAIRATLHYGNQQPFANQPCEFFYETHYAQLIINQSTTDNAGRAEFTYTNSHLSGNHTFGVQFNIIFISGDIYLYSEARSSIYISSEQPEDDQREEYFDILTILLEMAFWSAILFVWGLYAFVGYAIFRIARNGWSQRSKKSKTKEPENTKTS
ncbi:MAG: DOMON domain-containing protein [Candidatus Heimdallarchaeota archaeon]